MNNKENRIKEIENIVNNTLKIQTDEERKKEEKAVVKLTIEMKSAKRAYYLIQQLVALGILKKLPKEAEARLEKLKEFHSSRHYKNSCIFCYHKEKLIEVIGDKFYFLLRMV